MASVCDIEPTSLSISNNVTPCPNCQIKILFGRAAPERGQDEPLGRPPGLVGGHSPRGGKGVSGTGRRDVASWHTAETHEPMCQKMLAVFFVEMIMGTSTV